MSGESNAEESRRVRIKTRDKKVCPGNLMMKEKFLMRNRTWRIRFCPGSSDPEVGTCSIADSSIDDNSRNSGIDTYSDKNSSSGLELSELSIHTLLVETRARDLDREVSGLDHRTST